MSWEKDYTHTQVYFSALHIQLGSSPTKSGKNVPSTKPSETQENKVDRRSLNLPLKSLNTTVSQSDESFMPVEKSPKSSTPRQSLDPGADLPDYSLISMVGSHDDKGGEINDETVVEDKKNTTVVERKSTLNFTRRERDAWVPKDWYYNLQIRLDSLIWKYQNLDQEYAFLQKIAGEQYKDVRKLADDAAKNNGEN